MQEKAPSRSRGMVRAGLQWAALLLLSALIVAALEWMRLPAALLIGPMVAGIAVGVWGGTVRVPAVPFTGAQAIVGCLIAASIEPAIFGRLAADWPLLVGAVLATLTASSLLGILISRWGSLPGTTAVWGSTPGAASAMVLMADAFGADARLVAFMQYLRVLIVSASAALVARLWVDMSGAAAPAPVIWFPPLAWPDFAATLAVALVGTVGARLAGLPSPAFLGPMIIGTALNLGGVVSLQLPEWLLAASYALIGWTIGLRFTRPTLAHAARALPQVTAAILALIAFCGALAFAISRLLGVDPLTAFLATSPGGMDSIAIIAAASARVDLSFIMALQMARFLIVLVAGPPLARFIARRAGQE